MKKDLITEDEYEAMDKEQKEKLSFNEICRRKSMARSDHFRRGCICTMTELN